MIVYTFRTYPYIDDLRAIFTDVFIFGELKKDLETFQQLLFDRPDNVLGIADTKNHSRLEQIAVNRFNSGMIDASGPEELKLFLDPRFSDLMPAQSPTTTFCNWTMYRIQRFIDMEKIDSAFSFIHLNKRDLGKLKSLLIEAPENYY